MNKLPLILLFCYVNGFCQVSLDLEGPLQGDDGCDGCLLYTSPSPRDRTRSRMPSSA